MKPLASAHDLVTKNRAHFANESAAYRAARNELLVDEARWLTPVKTPAGPLISTRCGRF